MADDVLTEEELNKEADKDTAKLEKLTASVEEKITLTFITAIFAKNYFQSLRAARIESKRLISELQSESNKWADKTIPKAYDRAIISADGLIKKIGGKIKPQDAALHSLAKEIMADTIKERLNGQFFGVGRKVDDIYKRLAMQHIQDVASGKKAWQAGARSYLDDLLKNGVTGFKDSRGRAWNLKTYTENVIRTGVMETHLQATANRLTESGHDLIIISSHSKPCPKCKEWENKTLSLTGATKGYPTLEEAKRGGLFHNNCRHAFSASIDIDAEIAAYEKEHGEIKV